jgi:predicted HTH domain antitoxin
MSTITIPDEFLKEAGLDPQEALIEFACRLFDAGRLTLHSAGKLSGLDRVGMEEALFQRKIPIYRPTVEDVREDVAAMKRLGI